eukprot:TRINITY_DN1071_c0_g1_i2.p1 TRINITY_DN1071_c0_g1~~TRINITY_DN1071_c0_g1_i2.p1  ORF type:complete len:282 (-),score=101.84 TRINITY_DN1071_c0_g1_i2:288-1133(-)
MGSGASQEVTPKLKECSAEDLEKLFKELPAEEVDKVLKSAQAAKGGGDSGESSAPYLRKAFSYLAEIVGKMIEAEAKGEEEPEIDEEKMKETYQGYIKQSFEHHDKKKAGKLDKEDAAVFFKNFMQESQIWVDAVMSMRTKSAVDALKKEVEAAIMKELKDEYPNAKEHLPGGMKAAQAEMNKFVLLAKARAQGSAEAFAANKDALTCTAFTDVDEDGSGSLSLDEFQELMDPDSEKFQGLLKMMGIDMEKTIDAAEYEKCSEEAREAYALYMKEKLGIKD